MWAARFSKSALVSRVGQTKPPKWAGPSCQKQHGRTMEDSNLATASIVEEICLDAGTPAVEPGPAKRATLGLSLILLAISDYRTAPENSWMFGTAKGFLFPGKVDQEYRDHFDWVLAVARGIDADWLRETLDRARPEWDAERAAGRRRKAA